MTVTIRSLDEMEWPVLRDVRLKALRTDPGVFGSNLARETVYVEPIWRSQITDPDTGIFVLFDGDVPIGMTGITIDKMDAMKRRAILWGSWLESDYRGRGLSMSMYEKRLSWAQVHPTCETLQVSHRASNSKSKHANQKQGFVYTHTTSHIWPDGVTEDRVFYALAAKPAAVANASPRAIKSLNMP